MSELATEKVEYIATILDANAKKKEMMNFRELIKNRFSSAVNTWAELDEKARTTWENSLATKDNHWIKRLQQAHSAL